MTNSIYCIWFVSSLIYFMIGSGVSPESVIVLFSRSKTALILVGMSLFFCVKKTKEIKKISIFF